MNEKKAYSSNLRQEQLNRTREQILAALVRTMAQGVAGLSIPAVAREAGVSIPTVYRHFHTKQELIAALGSYLMQKMGVTGIQLPRSLDDLLSIAREAFMRAEGLDDTLKAAAVSELGSQIRHEGLPVRKKIIEEALAAELAQLSEQDQIHLRNMVLVLTSSAMIRAFKEYLDLSGEQAADTVIWAIRLLVRAATTQADDASPA